MMGDSREFKTYSAQEVAKFILTLSCPDEGDLMSNLKLQKLCYYALGIVAAVRPEGAPKLFDDEIQAWMHGPVVPNVYREFNKYGSNAIPCESIEIDFDIFDKNDAQIMSSVYDFYGQFSAWKLRQMTHEEAPWKDVYVDGIKGIKIRYEDMKSFFDGEIDDDFRRAFYVNEEEEAKQAVAK